LTAFFSFIDGKLPDGKEFKLFGLKSNKELNGKGFKELSIADQRKISRCQIRVITFKKDSDPDLQFEIFERLNSGSVKLNEQELRNCVYRGTFNNLIKELAEKKEFREILGLKDPAKKMKDRELVLRFSTFFFNGYQNYGSPVKKWLNKTMETHKDIKEANAKSLRDAFDKSIKVIKSLFGENAFKRFFKGDETNKNGKWERRQFNVALFEVLMDSFAREDKNNVFQNLDAIRESWIELMTEDDEFISSIERATNNKNNVETRFRKWNERIRLILGVGIKGPRCFSHKLKEELFNKDATCAICGNKIQDIDDAAVDHVKQYWMGGKTIPENARLTHRYCNNARARKEELSK
jgi:hypothetical protein